MTDDQDAYLLAITPTARRQLTDHLPETVAAAAYEFIVGPLLDDPHRVGKRLRPRWRTGTVPAAAPTGSSTAPTTASAPSPSSTSPTAATPTEPAADHAVPRHPVKLPTSRSPALDSAVVSWRPSPGRPGNLAGDRA